MATKMELFANQKIHAIEALIRIFNLATVILF